LCYFFACQSFHCSVFPLDIDHVQPRVSAGIDYSGHQVEIIIARKEEVKKSDTHPLPTSCFCPVARVLMSRVGAAP
jgi:hypothetical protein